MVAVTDSASGASLREADFVFVSLRALMSRLRAADPRTKSFNVVIIVLFGLVLAFFLVVDRVSLSSYRWAELYFLLVYLAAALFRTVFQFYELVLAMTTIGRRLRTAIRPVERLWVHIVLAVVATTLQILNYRTAPVDVTFGSNYLVSFLGVTTSATGCYEMFGAALFTYFGLVLILKISLIYIRFGQVFERSLPRRRERVEAMKTLLSLNLIALTGILLLGLYLICWRTGGFSHVVNVNSSFLMIFFALILLTIFVTAFTVQSRHLVTTHYECALSAYLKHRSGENETPLVVRKAPRVMLLIGYTVQYVLIALVLIAVVLSYAASGAVDRVLSLPTPLFSAFLSSPLTMFAVYVITSRFDWAVVRVAEDYRLLLTDR
jgi:hypothetical protein